MTFIDALEHYDLGELRYGVRCVGPADATPMVLLHGLMDTGAGFAPLADALQQRAGGRYRLIAPDWRGHGASNAIGASYWFPDYLRDLEQLLERVAGVDDERPAILVAHSMGGQVAALYAGVRPARVSHLVTLDSLNVPDSEVEDVPERYRRWLDAHAEPPEHRVYADLEAAATRIGKRYPELTDEQRRFLAEQWTEAVDGGHRLRVDPWHRVPLPYGFRAAEAMAVWQQVQAAVLCIEAGKSVISTVTGEENMQRRRACFADLEHRLLDNCGHMLHVQQPARVAELIDDFVQRRSEDGKAAAGG